MTRFFAVALLLAAIPHLSRAQFGPTKLSAEIGSEYVRYDEYAGYFELTGDTLSDLRGSNFNPLILSLGFRQDFDSTIGIPFRIELYAGIPIVLGAAPEFGSLERRGAVYTTQRVNADHLYEYVAAALTGPLFSGIRAGVAAERSWSRTRRSEYYLGTDEGTFELDTSIPPVTEDVYSTNIMLQLTGDWTIAGRYTAAVSASYGVPVRVFSSNTYVNKYGVGAIGQGTRGQTVAFTISAGYRHSDILEFYAKAEYWRRNWYGSVTDGAFKIQWPPNRTIRLPFTLGVRATL